jgi:Protein of unknown function (DUF2637)
VPPRRGLRLTAVIAAGLCVLAIAAGVIAFSYSDVRDTALTAGLSPRLARFYPLLFDAVLIVACAAAVTLRGMLRGYAWLAVLVTVGAIAAADIVHAMSIRVPLRPLEATIAVAPWVVLLTGLTLLDAMFRRTPGRKAQTVGPVSANGGAQAAGSAEGTAGLTAGAPVVPLSTLLHDLPPASGRRARSAASRPAAGASGGRNDASRPPADTSPDWTSRPAADTSPDWVSAGEPAADAGQPGATDADQDWVSAGEPAAEIGQPGASNASRDWVSAGEPAADAGQPGATASVPQTGADPAAADSHEGGPGGGRTGEGRPGED